ncbi:MAG: lanthionine synthetase C family protein [Pseudonocardiales bacterium]
MTHTDPLALPPEHDPEPGWGQSLSTGAAGLTLLHITYAYAGLAGWDTAHRWAAAMTHSPVAAHPDACLFTGAPAVAFVLRAADQPAYATALSTLDCHITALTRRRLDRAHERIGRGQLPRLREFDVINGLTGIGVYLLQADNTDLLRDVLSYLVRLVEPVNLDGQDLPGWWTGNGPADEPSEEWPGGHGNLGLAHGIAGPLTLMSTAMRQGITVSGQAAAIDRICAELDTWRCGTGGRTWWPGMISPTEWKTRAVGQPGPQRPSWCYGTPGLARQRPDRPPPTPAHPLRAAPPPSPANNLRRIAGRRSGRRADPAHHHRRTSRHTVGCLPAHHPTDPGETADGRNLNDHHHRYPARGLARPHGRAHRGRWPPALQRC